MTPRREIDLRPAIVVRRPSARLAAGELTHRQRQPVDPDLALVQWQGYVQTFADRGWRVVEIEPAEEHPDGVFVEDVVVIFDDVAVLTSPGAPTRRGEVESMATALRTLPIERPSVRPLASPLELVRITEPGHLEGGDVLKIGSTAYVGLSSRTDAEGVRQLRALLEPRGWSVVTVPVSRALHLKTGVTALPDGTVIGYEPFVDSLAPCPGFLGVAEEHGSAVVVLDEKTVVMSAAAPRTAELLATRGWDVLPVSITEFEKLEGCVTCLSVRVRTPNTTRSARTP